VRAPKIVLTHVRIVDGTGAPAVEDQNVIIEAGRVTGIQKGSDVTRRRTQLCWIFTVTRNSRLGWNAQSSVLYSPAESHQPTVFR